MAEAHEGAYTRLEADHVEFFGGWVIFFSGFDDIFFSLLEITNLVLMTLRLSNEMII
mgnify:CR=1 FL=1